MLDDKDGTQAMDRSGELARELSRKDSTIRRIARLTSSRTRHEDGGKSKEEQREVAAAAAP